VSTQTALLREITTHPADDLPRLVYADWLDENGDPEQAAFVRAAVVDPLLQPTEEQGKAWLATVGVPKANEFEPHFHRGIVEGIDCQSLSPLFEAAPLLFELFPIRELLFWWQYKAGLTPNTLKELAEMPGLDRLTTLRLANYDSPIAYEGDTAHPWRKFAACPRLAGLRFFGVDCARLTDADLEAIAASPVLSGLHTLSLEQNKFTTTGVRAILVSPHFQNLKRLSLGGNDGEGFDELEKELGERFPGTNPLDLFLEMEWFQLPATNRTSAD